MPSARKGENDFMKDLSGLKKIVLISEEFEKNKKASILGLEEFIPKSTLNTKEMKERNHIMTDRADALIQQSYRSFFDVLMQKSHKVTFIAVGAGHLPGEEGMCSLFRQKGYTVQRVFEDHHQDRK